MTKPPEGQEQRHQQQQQQQHESTPLLQPQDHRLRTRHHSQSYDADVESLLSSAVSKTERALHAATPLGERLPYNAYATIDWLHGLVAGSVRRRGLRSRPGLGGRLAGLWDAAQGWVAAAAIGLLTACVAAAVDVTVATVAGWKEGYCGRDGRWWLDRARCGAGGWVDWTEYEGPLSYAIYVGLALVFGVVAGSVTLTTKAALPVAEVDDEALGEEGLDERGGQPRPAEEPKVMYMAAGSGIPEIKTILSGFVIPHFLDLKVLVVKAVGATFAVATGMCLGKEGPFVHISTCVGYLVAKRFPKYRENERKMREILSVACSSGLSVAFGAPIGGVLFSYEEISTYFPRRVMWKAFLCSLVAAAALKELNPTGTGKLVLFETNYGVNYDLVHYLVFVFLGVCGGVFGGVFCQANFLWSKFFRKFGLIKRNPVLELSLVVLATALLQYPNRLIRDTGDIVMAELLVDCRGSSSNDSWICRQEAKAHKTQYFAWLVSGTLVKLLLTIITFGCKVPSGIIIPALDAGALFGRLTGHMLIGTSSAISPGIFAMVGAAAFLAGVSRMTVSLAVIMFELTGEVNFVPPFMAAILTSKWVADAISAESVYDLSQHLLGHPFLDPEHALAIVADAHDRVRDHDEERTAPGRKGTLEDLIPPRITMDEITLLTGPNFKVSRETLREKLARLKSRGLMDAGLVLVNERGICHGYLPEAELEFALGMVNDGLVERESDGDPDEVDLLDGLLAEFVDRCPITVWSKAPVEYAVEMFGKLGLRYLIIIEEETARVLGVVIKKRLVSYLDALKGM